MPLFYFHRANGTTDLDEDGTELSDIQAVRAAAIRYTGEVLRDGIAEEFWSGTPWRLWVTDNSDGGGKTILALHLSVSDK